MRSTSAISCSGARRIARHQLLRQLALEHDDRQRVAEQVVQVARDALALGELGQPLDFFLRHPQLRVAGFLGRRLDGDGADQRRDHDRHHVDTTTACPAHAATAPIATWPTRTIAAVPRRKPLPSSAAP